MKLTLKDVRSVISEVVSERKTLTETVKKAKILESRQERIKTILAEKDSWLGKLGNAFRSVNPSQEVDDPSRVQAVIQQSLGQANKIAQNFSAQALNTTKSINQFHDAVKNALDKVTSLGDTLGADGAAAAQKQVVDVVRQFYSLLKKEADRIASFQQIIKSDLESKGIKGSTAHQDTSGLKKKAAPAKNPASSTFQLGTRERGNATSTIRTNVPNPTNPSNKSFKAI